VAVMWFEHLVCSVTALPQHDSLLCTQRQSKVSVGADLHLDARV
jgi:hypothetical protein